MKPLEKQMKLSTDLYELNTDTWRKLFELETGAMKKTMQINQTLSSDIAQMKGVAGWMDVLQKFTEELWNNALKVMKTRVEIISKATESAGTLMKVAFESEPAAAMKAPAGGVRTKAAAKAA